MLALAIVAIHVNRMSDMKLLYVIVIPCPRGLYGIYCLSPRAKAINSIQPKGAWYNYFKAYYSNASASL